MTSLAYISLLRFEAKNCAVITSTVDAAVG